MTEKSLPQWLLKLKKSEIRLGIDRAKKVYKQGIYPLNASVIIVGGTNGKGSTCAFLDHIYSQANYKVGKLTSPELLHYNEQISLNGVEASDTQICLAFEHITQLKQNIELSYFEYLTLAALWLFKTHKMDIIILEVGLGGRLDCVNIVDANCCIITNIGLDHCDFLGNTLEKIAKEKIAITRTGIPLICGQAKPQQTLLAHIQKHKVPTTWVTQPFEGKIGLAGAHQRYNAQFAIEAVAALKDKHPINWHTIQVAIAKTNLLGRLQMLKYHGKSYLLDVAHNVDGAQALAEYVSTLKTLPKNTAAIFCALKDKNIGAIVDKISPFVNQWYLCPLPDERFCMTKLIQQTQQQLSTQPVDMITTTQTDIAGAIKLITQDLQIKQVLVFGSFLTVSLTYQALNT